MSVSHDTRGSSREARVLPGDLGASGGAAPLGGDMAAAGAEGGSEESARESEAWAAAVPPVRTFSRPLHDEYHLKTHRHKSQPASLTLPVLLQEWVPIIRCDMMTQRKMKAQPPLSDAYLHGMPAKRRKVIGSAADSHASITFCHQFPNCLSVPLSVCRRG